LFLIDRERSMWIIVDREWIVVHREWIDAEGLGNRGSKCGGGMVLYFDIYEFRSL